MPNKKPRPVKNAKSDSKPNVLEEQLTVTELIKRQRQIEGTTNKETKPLNHPVVAKPHTPIYTMHRYFARRPYNVFETIIKHYSRPGDLILDPFMGGGVIVVESLRARRKVVGIDLNPMSYFITKTEVKPIVLHNGVKSAFADIEKKIKQTIYELYRVKCTKCGGNAIIDWAYWSSIVRCPNSLCGIPIVTEKAKRTLPGEYRYYQCPNPECRTKFEPIDCERLGEEMLRIECRCSDCGKIEERDATDDDKARYSLVTAKYDEIISAGGLEFPQDKIPDGDRARDDALFRKGYEYFYQLFTRRNLLANTLLREAIKTTPMEQNISEALLFVFSSSLTWTCKMRKDIGHGWEHHGYWLPETHYESNVWDMFRKQFDGGAHSFWRGKEYSNREIGHYCRLTDRYSDIETGEATCLLVSASSHQLPLPDSSIDVVITDPPFGGNVQYAELSDFWAVWLKNSLGLSGVIDNTFEAVQTRHTGFPSEKSLEHYENMLFAVFKECHRVLKPHGWLVLTFHNREIAVWMALQRAANRGGFKLPAETDDPSRGMLYQPPIEHYTTTMHQRVSGAMLGDFILSFRRQNAPSIGISEGELSTVEEQGLIKKTEELIRFHGGADDSTLMTGLIPYLNEHDLFGKLATADFRPLFSEHFIWHKEHKKWFTSDMVELATSKLKPLDYVPAEQLTEQIIYDFLKNEAYASLDEILNCVYAKLMNSYRPGIPTINKVLNRICERVALPGASKREGFRLRTVSAEVSAKPPIVAEQKSLFGEPILASSLKHDEIVVLLLSYATKSGYEVHIGESEQKKNPNFRKISRQMISSQEFGLVPQAFNTITEIDLLFLKGSSITHAFEVATTVETANKAINDRYRNLFVSTPNVLVKAYVVVRDKDFEKAHSILFSKANIQDGVSRRVRIVRLSELTELGFERLIMS
jgi:putative DNA methylase